MNFGEALAVLKIGRKIARRGWNATNQYVYYVPANSYRSQTAVAEAEFGDSVPYGAYLAIKTVQGLVVPWAASQTDVLAEDWELAGDHASRRKCETCGGGGIVDHHQCPDCRGTGFIFVGEEETR